MFHLSLSVISENKHSVCFFSLFIEPSIGKARAQISDLRYFKGTKKSLLEESRANCRSVKRMLREKVKDSTFFFVGIIEESVK